MPEVMYYESAVDRKIPLTQEVFDIIDECMHFFAYTADSEPEITGSKILARWKKLRDAARG